MIFVQATPALPMNVRLIVEAFAKYAFVNTFPTVVINMAEFDPKNVCKGATDPRPGGMVVVSYNYHEGDSIAQILEVLAHESVHAHQLAEGRLKHAVLNKRTGPVWGFEWEGVAYDYPKTAREVLNLPWESEAYEMTPMILEEWDDMQREKNQKNFAKVVDFNESGPYNAYMPERNAKRKTVKRKNEQVAVAAN